MGNIYFAWAVLSNVENFRKDVSLISPSGIFNHKWYRDKQKINIFNQGNVIISHPGLYIAYNIFYNLINRGIIFLPPGASLIPYPFFYRLAVDEKYYPISGSKFDLGFIDKIYNKKDPYINWLLPFMLESRIVYEINHNKIDVAKFLFGIMKKNYSDYQMSKETILVLIKNKIIEY